MIVDLIRKTRKIKILGRFEKDLQKIWQLRCEWLRWQSILTFSKPVDASFSEGQRALSAPPRICGSMPEV